MKHYRGENSNIEDIAGRFDKHLQDPEPEPIRLTASASVVKCAPGRYQIATVLKDLVKRCYGKHSCPRLPAKERKPKGFRPNKKARERMLRETIYSLPDDASELWNRCSL